MEGFFARKARFLLLLGGNANLKMIGVSAYSPLIDTPLRVDLSHVFTLWQKTAKRYLDAFAQHLGRPIFLSEFGYRNSADAVYRPWEAAGSVKPDQEERVAACDAVLANIIPDQRIAGSFFWGWDDVGAFSLNGVQAVAAIHARYTSLRV